MLGLTRQDIINDDLGALNDVPFMFRRAAANSFNDVFWTAFLDDTTFFATGNSNVNEAGSALSVTTLDAARSRGLLCDHRRRWQADRVSNRHPAYCIGP